MTHYLSLAMPAEHLEKARALGVASWVGTVCIPEKGTELDRTELLLGLKTLEAKRNEFENRKSFDDHADQMRPLVERDGRGQVIEYPWLWANWAVDAEIWRRVQQAIPSYAALNLFYWLIPFGRGEIQTNHMRIVEANPKELRRLFIEEIKTAKP